ncbi:ATP-binding protein [Breznakiellaceae bacterium SP9]
MMKAARLNRRRGDVGDMIKIRFTFFFVFFTLAIFVVVLFTRAQQLNDVSSMAASHIGEPIARRAAAMVDGDKFEALVKSLDPTDPFYDETRLKLKALKEETQCLYVYTMAPYRGNIHRFIIDGGEPGDDGFSALGDQEDISTYSASYRRTYETGEVQHDDINLEASWGWVISTFVPLFNSAGTIVGVVGCDFDAENIYYLVLQRMIQQIIVAVILITAGLILFFRMLKAITKQNEELREISREALSASKAKSDFLANMSHEMRTPLNAIIGMTAIAKGAHDIEKKEYCLNKIENASAHLLGVINDILDMSKIEANRFDFSPIDFIFEKMLQKTVNVINFKVEEKQQHFTVFIDRNIPRTLYGDEQRLAQVIANLLSNAVKFTPDGGSIRLDAKLLGKEDGFCTLRISVSDTGIGLSPEQIAKLFTSFVQADSGTSRKFGGTGLGLAISKRIVEMMNGAIWVESEPGKGASFIFTVTLKEAAKELEETGPADRGTVRVLTVDDDLDNTALPPSGDANCFKGRKILLAEDIDINREIVMTLLEPTAVEIVEAENGKIAFEKFMASPEDFDMVFMDVQMPLMDGYTATRKIRAFEKTLPNHKPVPIVAMTANVFKEDIDNCLEAGMNGHSGKPLNLDDVMEKMRKYLKR